MEGHAPHVRHQPRQPLLGPLICHLLQQGTPGREGGPRNRLFSYAIRAGMTPHVSFCLSVARRSTASSDGPSAAAGRLCRVGSPWPGRECTRPGKRGVLPRGPRRDDVPRKTATPICRAELSSLAGIIRGAALALPVLPTALPGAGRLLRLQLRQLVQESGVWISRAKPTGRRKRCGAPRLRGL